MFVSAKRFSADSGYRSAPDLVWNYKYYIFHAGISDLSAAAHNADTLMILIRFNDPFIGI